jgi:hypothetical protein
MAAMNPSKNGHAVIEKHKKLAGLLAEFENEHTLIDAAHALRENGYTKTDGFAPFPVHGLDRALGIPKSILGWIVVVCGLTGTALAVLMIWYTGAVDYKLVIGGKPFFAFEFSVPIMFELTVLLGAFAAFLGQFALNGLPRFHHPLFGMENFKRATDDRFFLYVERHDPKFDAVETMKLMRAHGAVATDLVEEEA